ncbi:MAG: hypothetical protein ACI4AK_03745 [Lepagella sp.]
MRLLRRTRRVRVPLYTYNHTLTPIYDTDPDPGDTDPDSGIDNDTEPIPDLSGILESITFSMYPSQLEGYIFSRYSHPAMLTSCVIPDDDLPLVLSWFGGAPVTCVASDTLVKRLTNSVIGKLQDFIADSAAASLILGSCRIGCAIRLNDGTYCSVSTPVYLAPNTMAPLLAIREYALSGTSLQTIVEMICTPVKVTAQIPAFELPASVASRAEAIVFYATRQGDLLTGDETVEGVTTSDIYGETTRCWQYDRLSPDVIRASVMADSDLRIIGEVDIEQASAGIASLQLPVTPGALSTWKLLPKFDPNQSGSGGEIDDSTLPGGGEEGDSYSRIRLETTPLDLGYPDDDKMIREVALRGIYHRFPPTEEGEPQLPEISLYISRHRDRWRKIATGQGGYIRLPVGIRTRWVRVEVIAPRGSTFDAITFRIDLR